MDETKSVKFNIAEEIEYYFDDSSIVSSGQPEIVIIMGGVAVGKTTFRKVTLSLATLL
jgi:polynucleotide 5'-kinase involved in rRNA processing